MSAPANNHRPPDLSTLTAEQIDAMSPEEAEKLYAAATGADDARTLEEERERERIRLQAREDVAAERAARDVPPLQWWGIGDLLAAPPPEPLVGDYLYRDSLSRIFGEPGAGKTFVAIDLCMHVALGRTWAGHDVAQGGVVYVMAEGQRVNRDRVEAWLSHHRVSPEALEDRFIAVPHAVLLVEGAMRDFIARVAEMRPALVVLDTKNAMMVGEENSASDFAAMRRALDAIRRVSDACVTLVDHTGYGNTERARGTSAAKAGMDTEIAVGRDGDGLITVTVKRDKAAPEGTEEAFRLVTAPPSALIVPEDAPARRATEDDESAAWRIQDRVGGLSSCPGGLLWRWVRRKRRREP